MAHAGLELIGHAPHCSAAARGKNFDFDAVTLLKVFFQLLAHLGAGGNRDRNFTLSLCSLESLLPLGLPGRLRLSPELERKEQSRKSDREISYPDRENDRE